MTDELPPADPSTSRRAFLRLLGAGAGLLAAGVPVDVASAAGVPGAAAADAPRTLAAPRTLVAPGAARAVTVAAFAVDHVGVRGARTGTLRLPDAAGDLVDAVTLVPDCAAADGRGVAATAVRRAHGATRYAIDTSGTPVALNVTDGPPVAVRPRRNPRLGTIAYLDRARWGADESLRFDEQGQDRWGGPPTYFPVQKLTVHHTATDNDDPDPAGTVRAIYHFHTIERQFGDLGYQLLIDEAGRLYEGRYSGDDGIPGHDRNLHGVQGAHVGGYNSGNFGIALLGTFTDRSPTAAARRSLVAVLAVLARIHRLDPLGSGTYVNPVDGATLDTATIPGHLDWLATECPGRLTYEDLPEIREDVARVLRSLPDVPRAP